MNTVKTYLFCDIHDEHSDIPDPFNAWLSLSKKNTLLLDFNWNGNDHTVELEQEDGELFQRYIITYRLTRIDAISRMKGAHWDDEWLDFIHRNTQAAFRIH